MFLERYVTSPMNMQAFYTRYSRLYERADFQALIDLFQRKMFEPMSNEQHGSCDIPGSSVTKRRTQESNLEKSRSGLNNITSGGCLSALTGENVFLKEVIFLPVHSEFIAAC